MIRICLALTLLVWGNKPDRLYLPLKTNNRTVLTDNQLTRIGKYGLLRKARPSVPAHYHTGVDLKRPAQNYTNEPVLAAGSGKIISVRNDGPYSQIIIQHSFVPGDTLWTVYEHLQGITCHVGQQVDVQTSIARFFTKDELNRYGWQFDHVHFEILRSKPLKIRSTPQQPEYFFKTFDIICYTLAELHKRTVNPMDYFQKSHR